MRGASHRKVFIRTDANPVVAGGHVMRCLAVADALAELGADVEFVLSDGNPIGIIKGRGFQSLILDSDWRDLDGGVDTLCRLCDGVSDPVVLIDTYSVTAPYVGCLAAHAKVCYLGSKGGDLGGLSLIANYSTSIDEGLYRRTYGPRGTRLLLGAEYAPLRDCFAGVYRERRGPIARVLVTTGSTDPHGFTPAFLRQALADNSLGGVRFAVVVGGMVPSEVAADVKVIASADPRVDALWGVSDMASLMGECDAAVTASGTTVYELAAAGLPAVTFAMVEEQVESAESLSRLGATLYCGPLSGEADGIAAKCARGLAELVADGKMAAGLARRAHGLIDGFGACRIAKEIMNL